jgi:hypothetical protein
VTQLRAKDATHLFDNLLGLVRSLEIGFLDRLKRRLDGPLSNRVPDASLYHPRFIELGELVKGLVQPVDLSMSAKAHRR